MKNIQRLIGLLMILSIVISLLCIPAFAEETVGDQLNTVGTPQEVHDLNESDTFPVAAFIAIAAMSLLGMIVVAFAGNRTRK